MGMWHDGAHVWVVYIHARVCSWHDGGSRQALSQLSSELELFQVRRSGNMLGRAGLLCGHLRLLVLLMLRLFCDMVLGWVLMFRLGVIERARVHRLRPWRRIRQLRGMLCLSLTAGAHVVGCDAEVPGYRGQL